MSRVRSKDVLVHRFRPAQLSGSPSVKPFRHLGCPSNRHSTAHSVSRLGFHTEMESSRLHEMIRETSGISLSAPRTRASMKRGVWRNPANIESHLARVGSSLGVKRYSDWLQVTLQQLLHHNTRGPLDGLTTAIYGNSPRLLFFNVYHDVVSLPFNHSQSSQEQIELLDRIGLQIGVRRYSDWNNVPLSLLISMGHKTLTNKYGNMNTLLVQLYPSYKWLPWMHVQAPAKSRLPKDCGSQFLDIFGLHRISRYADWYLCKKKELKQSSFTTILSRPLSSTLSIVYPSYTWLGWNFSSISDDFWANKSNRLFCLSYFERILGIREADDWYHVDASQLKNLLPRRLFSNFYRRSLYRMLTDLYADSDWRLWRLPWIHKHDWALLTKDELKRLVDDMKTILNISSNEDWLRLMNSVDAAQLRSISVGGAIAYFGSLSNLHVAAGFGAEFMDVTSKVPPVDAQFIQTEPSSHLESVRKKSQQRWLLTLLQMIFPNEEIYENYLFNASIAERSIELDIYIPSLSLAFEYQGHQHYHTTPLFGDVAVRVSRDDFKEKYCTRHGIHLIPISYWWSGDMHELSATIKRSGIPLTPTVISK